MASNPPRCLLRLWLQARGYPSRRGQELNTYITYPKDKSADKAVLFLTDIFGIFPNAQLLADEFANNGFLTVIPDLFEGDQISVKDMESGKADLPAWLPKHQPGNIDPIIEKTIKYMRETLNVKKIAAVGYCFGGKYVTRYLKPGQIDVGYSAHPSFVTHEELGAIKGPFSIAAAETDSIFTTQLRHESEETLIKAGQPWQINLFSGVAHGFAVRGDLNDKTQKWAKEQAFCQAVVWFNQYL
ncbi:hypothetical protein N7481_009935 [Penicillium waksmanii]|uniref:uncharacterized protein n=1 Tax=Penicillium waksmanii TaxID=69791 RepID=UPI002547E7FF|nr:uncharacterized protein N7481_009935 [Penicillium waksmanii]KAJ5976228.1 hypothetical protein N7481_009935 [Penicillium waksmanii]